MKAKKLMPLLALVLCLSSIGGCTKTDEKIPFGNYWNTASLTNADIDETLVYDVRFDGNNNSMFNYKLSYENGKYVTHLINSTENGENIYIYTTELTIDVVYTLGSQTKTLSDSVTTEVRFLTAEKALRPISSKKTVISASPVNGDTSSVENCYQVYDYEVTTTYEADGSKGTSTVVDNTKESNNSVVKNFEIEREKYSYLDNEQLPFALRAIPIEKTSATALVYSPFVNKTQKVGFSFSSEESGEFSFFRAGNTETKAKNLINYREVKMVLKETNPGATQTALVAYTKDTQNNLFRNVILKLETPLSYGLGSLIYELNSTSW